MEKVVPGNQQTDSQTLARPDGSAAISGKSGAEMELPADRSKPIADWARESLSFEQLVEVFAAQVTENFDLKVLLRDVLLVAESQREQLTKLAGETKQAGLKAKLLASIATSEEKLKRFVAAGARLAQKTAAEEASGRGKAAAEALHGRAGGYRDKKSAVRAAWASGKYQSRTICAEEVHKALNISLSTARKALINTPDPT